MFMIARSSRNTMSERSCAPVPTYAEKTEKAGGKRKTRQGDGAANLEEDDDETGEEDEDDEDDEDLKTDKTEFEKKLVDMEKSMMQKLVDMKKSMAKVCTPTNPPHEAP